MASAIYLLGGGGHGRVALDALLECGVQVDGVLDPHLKAGDLVFGVPVLGGDDFLEHVDPGDALLVNGLGANPLVRKRRMLFEGLKARGFSFDAVHHPSAVVGRECRRGEGSQIMAGAVLQAHVEIGENAVVNTRASIDHDCVVGAHAFIAPGAVLCGLVTVDESAFIGAGAVVLPGVRIGADALVGAGAVVTQAVSNGSTVMGNPAVKTGKSQ